MPRWVPPALWAAFILSMATDLGSGENTGAVLGPVFSWFSLGEEAAAFLHGAARAAGHVFAYAVFALLVLWAARPSMRRPATLALGLALVLAIVDETLQGLVARERAGEVADVLLDGGAAACALVWWTALRARRVRRADVPAAATGPAAPAP